MANVSEKLGIIPKRFTIREPKLLEYCNALEKIVPELQREIKDKNVMTISMKDLAEKMGLGSTFKTSYDTYWGARYCLFDKGIITNVTKKDHEPVVMMRSRTPDDKLPPTLKRWFEVH